MLIATGGPVRPPDRAHPARRPAAAGSTVELVVADAVDSLLLDRPGRGRRDRARRRREPRGRPAARRAGRRRGRRAGRGTASSRTRWSGPRARPPARRGPATAGAAAPAGCPTRPAPCSRPPCVAGGPGHPRRPGRAGTGGRTGRPGPDPAPRAAADRPPATPRLGARRRAAEPARRAGGGGRGHRRVAADGALDARRRTGAGPGLGARRHRGSGTPRCCATSGPAAAAAEQLWAALVRELPDPEAAEPAALLAVSALLRGDGALANVALDRAEQAWPGHRLTRLLRWPPRPGCARPAARVAHRRSRGSADRSGPVLSPPPAIRSGGLAGSARTRQASPTMRGQVGALRAPAQLGAGRLAGGDEHRGVAVPARRGDRRDRVPGHRAARPRAPRAPRTRCRCPGCTPRAGPGWRAAGPAGARRPGRRRGCSRGRRCRPGSASRRRTPAPTPAGRRPPAARSG